MSKVYLRELVDFAQKEIPLLQNDLQNASTLYTLQSATQRLFNVTTYMLHHIVHAAYESGSAPATPVAPPAPPPAPPAPVLAPAQQAPSQVAPAFAVPAGMPRLPAPNAIPQPTPGSAANSDPNGPNVTPGVTNVIITPQGTQVVSPTGVTAVVPPGEHVGLDLTQAGPPQPFVEPGVATVILPPGGGFTPDVAAALDGRSGQAPE
jgi:hypothetical protein